MSSLLSLHCIVNINFNALDALDYAVLATAVVMWCVGGYVFVKGKMR